MDTCKHCGAEFENQTAGCDVKWDCSICGKTMELSKPINCPFKEERLREIEQFINWGALHYLPEARERVKQALSEIKQLQDANKCSYGDCDIYEVFYRD